jgi:hypothetical protein
VATLHDQNISDTNPTDTAYRHASIAETQDPTIGTPMEPGRSPNELLLASDIPLRVWRDLLLSGAYDPAASDERFNWTGSLRQSLTAPSQRQCKRARGWTV